MVEKKKTAKKSSIVTKAKTTKAKVTKGKVLKTKTVNSLEKENLASTNKKVKYIVTKERVAAIVGLVALFVLLIGLLVALITANGKLAMAMIFSLAFVSILLFIVLRLYK